MFENENERDKDSRKDVEVAEAQSTGVTNLSSTELAEERSLLSDSDKYVSSAFEDEEEHDIKYRTCSWQHTTGLMLSEYIVLAIMSFPWSYSVLGLVPGLILTVFVAVTVLYTGLIILNYCE